jgi:hypothetical protein
MFRTCYGETGGLVTNVTGFLTCVQREIPPGEWRKAARNAINKLDYSFAASIYPKRVS